MPTQSDSPTAQELLEQFKQAISDYHNENRTSGTMVIPKEPVVRNNYDDMVGMIKYDPKTNRIIIY